jgi:hypothetical protein
MSLDDVDLWNLYLDSVDEATSRPDQSPGGDD